MQTRRERITELLESTAFPMTAEEICERLDIKSRSIVYEDIDHVSKSVKRREKELLIRPASCGKCQFAFKPRKTSKAPSKCPKCRSQWILAPAFLIRQRKQTYSSLCTFLTPAPSCLISVTRETTKSERPYSASSTQPCRITFIPILGRNLHRSMTFAESRTPYV